MGRYSRRRRAGLSSVGALCHHTKKKSQKYYNTTTRADTHLFSVPRVLAHVLVLLRQDVVDLLDHRDLLLLLLVREGRVAEGAAGLLEALEVLLDPLDVLQAELRRDDLHIANRVDVALDVDDLRVIERAHDLEDAVDGAHVGQERVAEARARRRARGETGDVDARQVCGDAGRGLVGLAEPVKARVRDGDTGFLVVVKQSTCCTLCQ